MAINRANVRKLLQDFDFRNLFIEEMGWGSVPNTRPAPMDVDGTRYMRRLIAQMSGVSVFEIFPLDPNTKLPDAKTRAAIHKQIEALSHENLLIFLDDDGNRTQSMWYWVKRDGKKKQAREHLYLKGQPGDLFLSKLDGIVIDLDDLREDGTIPITEVTSRLAESLDVERVTKKFYTEFSTLRVDFIDMIEGIEREADRFWYASVLLNRLMFIYFLQKRGFIQNNTRYLDHKLDESKNRGADRYFSEFLHALFFEGFAKPENQRSEQAKALLGPIRYLNGGLFIPHKLEIEYQAIRIPDKAFENVLDLFGSYSWHLDDTPGADDNEINPDVLGYIFEKYINQKAFGAYYTRTEITQYLCERTIHAVILDRIHQNSTRKFSDLNEVLVKLDADLCRLLLFTVLPKISILDPACGSGAFLVAAMKTLLDIYAAVYGKIRFLNDTNLTAHLKEIDGKHPSINYYVRKRIITDNLYGVDIMEEAAEIAKLRLFLVLVSSAQKVEDLEPLPNIDFNIMTGNSLIGLLTVDPERFDATNQSQDMLQRLKAQQYKKTLEEKNRQIDIYRKTSSVVDDLQALRERIDELRRDAYQDLNEILLDDFNRLGIRFEQVQLKGNPKKRALKIADIERLNPFHWGYEFDEIIETRGGFDVIIANPPWEVFHTDEKEFFSEYSDVITKKKMSFNDFVEKRDELLDDPDIQAAWLDYASQFPHQNAYFKQAVQYENQTSLVNGRKVTGKTNLFKVFVEQCFNLIRDKGRCGIVVPASFYIDADKKQLREMLFSKTEIEALFGFSNEKFIFETVHHAFKVCLLIYEKGGKTDRFEASFRINASVAVDPNHLSDFLYSRDAHLLIDVDLIRRIAPDTLLIPEFRTETEIVIAEKLSKYPLLGEDVEGKWNIDLTTEFDKTANQDIFFAEPNQDREILYEGRMIFHYTHQFADPQYFVDTKEARNRLNGTRGNENGFAYQKYRLIHRRVTGQVNERTLVCTIIPSNRFCDNSVNYVIPSGYNTSELLFACAILSSFIFDFQVRGKINNNVTIGVMKQLSLPRCSKGDPLFSEVVDRVARLICTTSEFDDLAREVGLGNHKAGITNEVQRAKLRAELDGMIAHIYGLTEEEFAYILSTFNLVPEPVKVAARNAYRDVERGLVK